MPRFYLHLRDSGETIRDEEGQLFPSEEIALREAKRGACEVLFEKIRLGELIDGDEVEVADETGRVISTVRLRGLIRLDDGDK